MMKKVLLLGCLLSLVGCSETVSPLVVDDDADGYAADVDCADDDAAIHPDATETCNMVDDDCDASVDEALGEAVYADTDADGYGDAASSRVACGAVPTGYVVNDDDCDDGDDAYHPGATETCSDDADFNCDGSTTYADADDDGVPACLDCDDTDALIHPGATEICDAKLVDEDCDGTADDADDSASGKVAFHTDADEDAHGAGDAVMRCHAAEGLVVSDDDCDDTESDIYPGAPETCSDAEDLNCDGSTLYADADDDGVPACLDCDDDDAVAYPGAQEVCDTNLVDEDCDGAADDDDDSAIGQVTFYTDADADGYGGEPVLGCHVSASRVADDADCDDTVGSIHPGATEICDGIDQDCDATIDFGYVVPTTHATVQAAINVAPAGSHICVLEGTHGPFDLVGKNLTIEGQDRASTIIDATGTANAVRMYGSEGTVRSFTIQNATRFGVLSSGPQTGLRVFQDLDIHSIHATHGSDASGIVHFDGASSTLRGVSIHDCSITTSAQASGFISLTNNGAVMTLDGVSVRRNTITAAGNLRGSVFAYAGRIVANNVVIAGNTFIGSAANRVVWTYGFAGDTAGSVGVSVVNADIVGNHAGANTQAPLAVAVYAPYDLVTSIRNVTAAYNTSDVGTAARAFHVHASASVTYCDVYGNDPITGTNWGGIADGTGTNGNVAVAPLYTDQTGDDANIWDLTLASGSPLIDAGDPGILDVDGTTSDIGAYGGPLGDF